MKSFLNFTLTSSETEKKREKVITCDWENHTSITKGLKPFKSFSNPVLNVHGLFPRGFGL